MHLESTYYEEVAFVIDLQKNFMFLRRLYPLLLSIEYFILLLQLEMELLIVWF